MAEKSTDETYEYDIIKNRFGTFTSVLKSTGDKMTTGLTEEAVRIVTDTIRIPVMKGEFKGWESKGRSSVVDGKL